jgi:hypothetical protein
MRTAFTSRSGGWSRAIRQKAKELKLDPKEAPALERARAELYKERDGERQAVLAWLRTESGQQQAYDEDSFTLPPSLTGHPLTAKYLNDDSKTVKIQSILSDRCVRCHSENTGGGASNFPLDTYERVKEYSEIERTGGGMSLTKLAQTTHVHLLGFSMLYGLTGLIFCFTSYHWGLKLLLAPLPLVAQVADISCWWLARFDPFFARAIIYTGGVVALGLGLQILLSLFDLFGWKGKLIVLVAILAGAVAGLEIDRHIIQPYLASEKAVTSERPGMD